MSFTHREIFERYVYADAISRNRDAVAAMFTEDGVYEAPLVPDSRRLPRRLAGRDAISTGMSAFHQQPASQGTANVGQSRFVLHDTTDADVFIAEIDTVLDHPAGQREPVSLVQIFRAGMTPGCALLVPISDADLTRCWTGLSFRGGEELSRQ